MAKSHLKNISAEYNLALGNNKFKFLFEDAKKRQEYQKNISQNDIDTSCTFHPNIVPSQRTCRSKSPLPARRKPLDPPQIFKRPTFTPETGRAPKTERNPRKKPIGEYLHEIKKILDSKHTLKKVQQEQKIHEQSNEKHVQEKSLQLAKKRRFEAYTKVFALLDSDGDSVISAQKVEVTRIFPRKANRNASRIIGIVYTIVMRDGTDGTSVGSDRIL